MSVGDLNFRLSKGLPEGHRFHMVVRLRAPVLLRLPSERLLEALDCLPDSGLHNEDQEM